MSDGVSNVPPKYIVGAIVTGQQGRMSKEQARANVLQLLKTDKGWTVRNPCLQLPPTNPESLTEVELPPSGPSIEAIEYVPRIRSFQEAGSSRDVTMHSDTPPSVPVKSKHRSKKKPSSESANSPPRVRTESMSSFTLRLNYVYCRFVFPTPRLFLNYYFLHSLL